MRNRPVIGVSCCLRSIAFNDYPPTPHHTVFHKYVDFVTDRLQAIPVLLPPTSLAATDEGYQSLVRRLDGLLLTGSPSNVGMRWTPDGFTSIVPKGSADHARDLMVIHLIRDCLEIGVPILGICRGMQEINVTLGGSLHDEIHSLPGCRDHRSDKSLPYERRYSPRHSVRVEVGSLLSELLKIRGVSGLSFDVNSLHGQGVSKLGTGIVVEAVADDGVVEAISVGTARAFAVGVQWHIEWASDEQLLDQCVISAFKAACEAKAESSSWIQGVAE